MAIAIRSSRLYIQNLRTRIPFRYGIARMTVVPHLFVQCTVEVDGQLVDGLAADSLIPKWFTKDPHTSYQEDIQAMLESIQAACSFAQAAQQAESVFALWRQVYQEQSAWGTAHQVPALLWNFGASLVERAAIDAWCRAKGIPFARALHANLLGVKLVAIHPELAGRQPADLLPEQPLESLIARHTIGLADPLTEGEIEPSERVDDGLPQSLEACIRAYGLSHFKVKVSGQPDDDILRLRQIAAVLDANAPAEYTFTLDGNEQFTRISQFQAFWDKIQSDWVLGPWLNHLLFVEQPLVRDSAFYDGNDTGLLAWEERPPIIIDESDSQLHSLETALSCGYAGTSHKNCKGVFKSIANACLLAQRCQQDNYCYILSGEDLANIGPVALLQDLAVAASLGIKHVERNGHHYFAGLSLFSQNIQDQMTALHPDLYSLATTGFPSIKISAGRISTASVNQAPFGSAFILDANDTIPLERWDFNSLDLETQVR